MRVSQTLTYGTFISVQTHEKLPAWCPFRCDMRQNKPQGAKTLLLLREAQLMSFPQQPNVGTTKDKSIRLNEPH